MAKKVRSAVTGRYVKKSKASTDPTHTVTETDKSKGSKKSSKPKGKK